MLLDCPTWIAAGFMRRVVDDGKALLKRQLNAQPLMAIRKVAT